MTQGDIIRHKQSGRYGIVLHTAGDNVRVVQVHIKASGEIVRQSRTTWRVSSTEWANLDWLQVDHDEVRMDAWDMSVVIVETDAIRNFSRRDMRA